MISPRSGGKVTGTTRSDSHFGQTNTARAIVSRRGYPCLSSDPGPVGSTLSIQSGRPAPLLRGVVCWCVGLAKGIRRCPERSVELLHLSPGAVPAFWRILILGPGCPPDLGAAELTQAVEPSPPSGENSNAAHTDFEFHPTKPVPLPDETSGDALGVSLYEGERTATYRRGSDAMARSRGFAILRPLRSRPTDTAEPHGAFARRLPVGILAPAPRPSHFQVHRLPTRPPRWRHRPVEAQGETNPSSRRAMSPRLTPKASGDPPQGSCIRINHRARS
jgi:hypothetical protein